MGCTAATPIDRSVDDKRLMAVLPPHSAAKLLELSAGRSALEYLIAVINLEHTLMLQRGETPQQRAECWARFREIQSIR